MGLLIDTSVFIDHERGRLDLAAAVTGREDENVFVSVITASELLHGVHPRPVVGRSGRAGRGCGRPRPVAGRDLRGARARSGDGQCPGLPPRARPGRGGLVMITILKRLVQLVLTWILGKI